MASNAPDRHEDCVLDHPHLARYTLGNRDLEREILSLFSTQSRLYLEDLRKAARPATWRDAAHGLKGSARAVGARRVAALAESAERNPAPDGKPRIDQLAALERAVAEVADYIATLEGGGGTPADPRDKAARY